jgi:hypothetical protein
MFMKKVFMFIMAIAIIFSAQAASTPSFELPVSSITPLTESPNKNANEIMLPIGNTGKMISLKALSEISVQDFERISGKKLKFFDKIGFKLGQKKLRNKIGADGTIKSKVIKKYAEKMGSDGESGFHVGGFALGFLLGLIGVLIAYIINDEKKRNRIKWAWIGFGVAVVLILVASAL